MSRINEIIPEQNLERIGLRIAAIIGDELNNQYALTGDDIYKCTVFAERYIGIDKTELPAINIVFSGASNQDNTPETSKYEYTYSISIIVNSKSQKGLMGDAITSKKLLRLISVVRYILMNPNYLTLAFDDKFIYTRAVSRIDIENYDSGDGKYTLASLLEFSITIEEHNGAVSPGSIDEVGSMMRLDETEKGYLIEVK